MIKISIKINSWLGSYKIYHVNRFNKFIATKSYTKNNILLLYYYSIKNKKLCIFNKYCFK